MKDALKKSAVVLGLVLGCCGLASGTCPEIGGSTSQVAICVTAAESAGAVYLALPVPIHSAIESEPLEVGQPFSCSGSDTLLTSGQFKSDPLAQYSIQFGVSYRDTIIGLPTLTLNPILEKGSYVLCSIDSTGSAATALSVMYFNVTLKSEGRLMSEINRYFRTESSPPVFWLGTLGGNYLNWVSIKIPTIYNPDNDCARIEALFGNIAPAADEVPDGTYYPFGQP